MKISQQGLQLIKESEGLRLQAYRCPAGKVTIGYGHTRTARMGMSITSLQAEELLLSDCREVELALNTSGLRLNQQQFDALADFVFNLGVTAFRSSTLIRVVRANPDDQRIAFELRRWNKITNPQGMKVVSPGLARRREKEIALYYQS